jgi:hypothetical protein
VLPVRIAEVWREAAKWIELSGRVTLEGVNKEDPYGPAEGFVFLQIRAINLWNYQLVPRLCSTDICAAFVAPTPEITVLIMSDTRVAGAVCQDDDQSVEDRGPCMVLQPLCKKALLACLYQGAINFPKTQ